MLQSGGNNIQLKHKIHFHLKMFFTLEVIPMEEDKIGY